MVPSSALQDYNRSNTPAMSSLQQRTLYHSHTVFLAPESRSAKPPGCQPEASTVAVATSSPFSVRSYVAIAIAILCGVDSHSTKFMQSLPGWRKGTVSRLFMLEQYCHNSPVTLVFNEAHGKWSKRATAQSIARLRVAFLTQRHSASTRLRHKRPATAMPAAKVPSRKTDCIMA